MCCQDWKATLDIRPSLTGGFFEAVQTFATREPALVATPTPGIRDGDILLGAGMDNEADNVTAVHEAISRHQCDAPTPATKEPQQV